MQVIKSVKDLPEWFNQANYKKNLNAVDWYREIRKRDYGLSAIDFVLKRPEVTSHPAKDFFYIFHSPMKKDWALFYLPQWNYPVEDMSKIEALYLVSCLDDETCNQELELFRVLLKMYKEECTVKDRTVYSRAYEETLKIRFDRLSEESEANENLNSLVKDQLRSTGNPFLSYGRPIQGYPVVIDTTYDDETILTHMRKWLVERRNEDGEKAKRPYRQNDFDDWSYYKIREVCDLDTWARVNDVSIPDRVIAAALWPHSPDEMSPVDVLRTTTRKKIKEIFQYEVCLRLYGQLRLELGENFLDE